MNELPNFPFEWLEKPFNELDKYQQNEVLIQMTEEEYNDLYTSNLFLSQLLFFIIYFKISFSLMYI